MANGNVRVPILLCNSCVIVRSCVYYPQHNSMEFYFFHQEILSFHAICYFSVFSLKILLHANAFRGKFERAHRSINRRDKRGKKKYSPLRHRYFAFDFCVSPFGFSFVREREKKPNKGHQIWVSSDDLPLFSESTPH